MLIQEKKEREDDPFAAEGWPRAERKVAHQPRPIETEPPTGFSNRRGPRAQLGHRYGKRRVNLSSTMLLSTQIDGHAGRAPVVDPLRFLFLRFGQFLFSPKSITIRPLDFAFFEHLQDIPGEEDVAITKIKGSATDFRRKQ